MDLTDRSHLPTPKQAMNDLLDEGTTASCTKELGDASTGATLFTQHGGYPGHGCVGLCGRIGCCRHRGHSGSSRTRDSHESKRTYHKNDTNMTDACRKRISAGKGGNNDDLICFQYELPVHSKVD